MVTLIQLRLSFKSLPLGWKTEERPSVTCHTNIHPVWAKIKYVIFHTFIWNITYFCPDRMCVCMTEGTLFCLPSMKQPSEWHPQLYKCHQILRSCLTHKYHFVSCLKFCFCPVSNESLCQSSIIFWAIWVTSSWGSWMYNSKCSSDHKLLNGFISV